MSQLPKGWVKLALGSLCSKLTDGSHNPPKAKESGLPMLSAKNIQNGKLHFGLGSRLISEDEFIVEDKRTRISQGDVLLTIVGALGRAAVVTTPEKFTLQRSVAVLNAPLVSPFFLKYSFESPAFQKQVFDNAKGTAQKGIYLKKLRELSISLPPAAEQTRIVEKLDEVLAQVDTIKARLDGIPAILKRFRQSVLAAAVSGKLTEELRFERLEHSEHKLKEILDITSGIAFKKSQYSEEGSRLLQIANVSYGKAKWDKESFVSLELAKEYKDYGLIEGDLVMALNRPITNGMLKVAQIVRNDLPATLYQRVARLRVKEAVKTTLATEYLFLSLRSSEFREQVEQNLKGSDQPYLNTSTLGELNISIYLLEEQKEIVRLVDQYFAFADTIEAQVKKAQARVDKLTQSILAKAFRGELVPQDPNDEPADKLLERIALARKEAEVLAKAAKKAAKK
ncbi:TPA: restriction endonuclease subunit S [Vibrio cholerae]|uniref:Type I restriction endonuclease subunit S n=1 Tax=Vibrio cholerae TaxID=666 RepID=A0ABD7SP20_VIBCL|nr:restriction endonuclease subunit S [Vibrio cholerae]EKE6106395.1 restriction endonuclease subunit S [Vibrio cholerae]EKF9756482.1 restriction endonuclease subunit S [Vibrio cholerae]TXX66515.1 type I restriction endonuclease subunit S [Vibrio cholerae]GHZ08526.1 Type-1 restriction enzyme EcoKI specificity protein [Vibrio cholerae]GIA96591.1 Type-1 restriction enzyme EcoKI specificity protein [Vibrio cholerae]